MDTTPLDGYKKIIVTLLTLASGMVGIFITDPAKAQTIGQFLVDVLGPVLITLVGIVYTIVQGNIDKEKAKTAAVEAKAQAIMAQEASPKADSAAAVAAPIVTAEIETYQPADLAKYITAAEGSIKADGQMITPLSRAFYFWPYIAHFDLRDVPRQLRINEAKRFVDKGIELFEEAFKFHTKLAAVPTPAQAGNQHSYMFQLKKDYEKANNLLCSNKTFEDLRNLVAYFNDLYTAQDGLNQLTDKTVDWSIYGSGAFTPTQVGWDYAKLL
jgi:hypothetical protein